MIWIPAFAGMSGVKLIFALGFIRDDRQFHRSSDGLHLADDGTGKGGHHGGDEGPPALNSRSRAARRARGRRDAKKGEEPSKTC